MDNHVSLWHLKTEKGEGETVLTDGQTRTTIAFKVVGVSMEDSRQVALRQLAERSGPFVAVDHAECIRLVLSSYNDEPSVEVWGVHGGYRVLIGFVPKDFAPTLRDLWDYMVILSKPDIYGGLELHNGDRNNYGMMLTVSFAHDPKLIKRPQFDRTPEGHEQNPIPVTPFGYARRALALYKEKHPQHADCYFERQQSDPSIPKYTVTRSGVEINRFSYNLFTDELIVSKPFVSAPTQQFRTWDEYESRNKSSEHTRNRLNLDSLFTSRWFIRFYILVLIVLFFIFIYK